MTDRPIIFSAPMVRALLEGRKTMTRRLAQSQRKVTNATDPRGWNYEWRPSPWQKVKPGDRLWVRENFRAHADGPMSECTGPEDFKYMATAGEAQLAMWKWRPSIHLPRWASRLTLVVTAVKIERLWNISDADALAEGIVQGDDGWYGWDPKNSDCNEAPEPDKAFFLLWERLHGEESFAADPELVALTFTVHKCNIDAMKAAA